MISRTSPMNDLLSRREALGFGLGGFLGFALGRQQAAFGEPFMIGAY